MIQERRLSRKRNSVFLRSVVQQKVCQIRNGCTDKIGSGFFQLAGLGKTEPDAERGNAAPFCREDVMIPVADHEHSGTEFGLDAELRKQLLNHLGFVRMPPVEFGSEYRGKIFRQTKMLQNSVGEQSRFSGGDGERTTLSVQRTKHWKNAVVDAVFKDTGCAIAFAVFFGCGARLFFGKTVIIPECVKQRWADEPAQKPRIAFCDSKRLQRILYAACDSGGGIGERAVQIKKNGVKAHESHSCCRPGGFLGQPSE